jgi:hypothetical protein
MDWIAVVAVIGAIVTAGATIMLWRVTGVLAVETKRLAMATAQPQIVVTIEPNQWSMMHADVVIANTGNATAFNISIQFDPPLTLNHEGTTGPTEPPFQSISALRPSQKLNSWVGKMHELLEQRFTVSISWRRSPLADPESYTYVLDMSDYRDMRRLGSGDPLVQIAERSKRIQEDIHKFTTGWRKLKVDVYTSNDREGDGQYIGEVAHDENKTDPIDPKRSNLLSWLIQKVFRR